MSSSTLLRASGLAGLLCGLVILLQRLVIDTIAPGSPIVIGPFGPVLGLLVLTGAYLRQREESGLLGGIAFLVSFVSTGFVAGVDFSRRYVLVNLPPEVVSELFMGPTRLLFLACGVAFLAGVLLFGLATFRARIFPRAAIVLYVVGFIPYALSPFFPPAIATAGQSLAALGVIGLGWTLWTVPQPAAPRAVLATAA